MSLWRYVLDNSTDLQAQLLDQLLLAAVSIVVASAIGISVGIAASRWRRIRAPALGIASVAITLPSFALFSALSAYVGIGDLPVEIGLVIYALLPIMRNTVVGIQSIDPDVVDAAVGMGMTPRQCLVRVELPLAVPLIIGGIRQATVMIIAIGTVGAAVGANDLGQQIFAGIRDSNTNEVLAGVIPVTVLALIADRVLGGTQWLLTRGRAVPA